MVVREKEREKRTESVMVVRERETNIIIDISKIKIIANLRAQHVL